ncbi:MAG: thioredoxin family protein [Desulfobaccales bacterium]
MPDEDVTQITLGRFKIGITGLKAAIAAVQALGGLPEGDIARELLTRLKPKNYIPAAAQEAYGQAFRREFKKALGEQVEEEQPGLSVKILGAGCPACDQLERTVMAVLEELGLPAAVEQVRDLPEILAYGVMGVPALLINGQVKAAGQLPTKKMLKNWLIAVNLP